MRERVCKVFFFFFFFSPSAKYDAGLTYHFIFDSLQKLGFIFPSPFFDHVVVQESLLQVGHNPRKSGVSTLETHISNNHPWSDFADAVPSAILQRCALRLSASATTVCLPI